MSEIHRLQDASGIVGMTGDNLIYQIIGTGVPTDGLTGYLPGCIYQRRDGTTASTIIYTNSGTATSTTWVALDTDGTS